MMLDFLFRRGNPTNGWQRTPGLMLNAALDRPSLNGVTLGSQFEQLSFLGRNDRIEFGTYCYTDLGIGVDCDDDGSVQGFMIVLRDENREFQPYRGICTWKQARLDLHQLNREHLVNVFGPWYWMDSDEDESIAFYEYPTYEMQIEIALSGAINRCLLSTTPLMADSEQREAYGVDKPWPPQYAM